MVPTTTNLSLHLITGVEAIDRTLFGGPLTLRFFGKYNDAEVTAFFQDEALAVKLTKAINATIEAHKAEGEEK